jgi:hypothetical protein
MSNIIPLLYKTKIEQNFIIKVKLYVKDITDVKKEH